jgi:hypothetical protein
VARPRYFAPRASRGRGTVGKRAATRWITALVVALIAAAAALYLEPGLIPGRPPAPAASGTALEQLGTLAVKGRAPQTGYDREGKFGEAWVDVDGNGCDTRNDILSRDLDNTVVDDRCRVLTGVIDDPYTNTVIEFVRGESTSALVQIDHVVALSNAWQTGAQQLSQSERIELANDPTNLLAVDGSSNSQKGDGDTATWLPRTKSFRCEYVARQIAVKAEYSLWVTAAEKEAMLSVLATCPDQPVPSE